jgi:hypothetical protein
MPLSSPFVNSLILLSTLCLLAVFALAAIAKLCDPARARDGLIGFGVPPRWARPSLVVLVSAEMLIAGLLAYPPTRLVGAWSALATLIVFSLAIAWHLARGRRPACACFGALTPAAISWKSVGRNLLLIGLAGGLIVFSEAAGVPPFATIPVSALLVLAWIAISAIWLLLLTRQNGRLLLRIQHLEQINDGKTAPIVSAGPLRVGSVVPPLGLRDARGRPFDLGVFRGRSVLLLFLDAGCNHCQPLLDRLHDQMPSNTTTLVVISGSESLRHALPPEITLLLDPGWSSMTLFGLQGTPAAVTLDEAGRVAHLATHGTSAVHTALDQITPQEVHREWAPV